MTAREPERTATAAGPAIPPPGTDDQGCPAESGNWYCTLDAGHPGDHVAHGTDDYVCHTWPQDGPRLDSESWTCRSCGGTFIGGRPADGTCGGCVVTEVTTDPPAQPRRDWQEHYAQAPNADRIPALVEVISNPDGPGATALRDRARAADPAENPPPLSRDLSGDLLGLPGGRPLSQCSNPPAESCSDAGCPEHGDGPHLDYEPDYEPGGTERPGVPRAVAGPPIDLGDDPDGDNSLPPGVPPRAARGQPECGSRASDGHVCNAAPHAGDHAAYEMSTGGDHLLRTWPRGAAWLPTEAELAAAPRKRPTAVTVNVWMHDGPLTVERFEDSHRWATIRIGTGVFANLFVDSAAQCDALIAAATEARAHVTGGGSRV